MRFTLPAGPSDHKPIVCDFDYSARRLHMPFRAAGWNSRSPKLTAASTRVLNAIAETKPHIVTWQESSQQLLDYFGRHHGFRHRFAEPEFGVSWNPGRFEYVRHHRTLMSPVEYWTINYALVVVLRDVLADTELKVLSYHFPAHVQVPKHPSHAKVMAVHRDAAAKRRRMAQASPMPFLSQGDSNIDPLHGWAPEDGWDWQFDREPLQYVRPGDFTSGRRVIDEWNVAGLVSVRQ